MKISFRKKFHLASSHPKNTDADILYVALRNEFETYCETADPSAAIMKNTRKGLKSLEKVLSEAPVGARLDIRLANAPLGNPGAVIISRAFSECKAIKSLSLIKCGFDSQSMLPLAKLLSTLHLDELNLSGNELQTSGFLTLIGSINPASPIPALKLSAIGLTDETIPPMLEFLASVKSTFSLDISKQAFSKTSVEQLIGVTGKNIFIIGLNLEGSGISEERSRQLYEILGKNEAVTGVLENLLAGACRRNFKTRLMSFRESVQQSRVASDAVIEPSSPVYKWLQKSKLNSNNADVPSERFISGLCLDTGRRNEMQDVICIRGNFQDNPNQDFFALFDGHGGREPATYCAQRLPVLVSEILTKHPGDPGNALKEAFHRCNKEMEAWATMSGTTAVVALLIDNQRYIANLGDSKAVICQQGSVSFSTKDHKATDPDEIGRIQELGGQVVDGRVNGQLSITRALGDSNLSPFVIPTPDIYEQVASKYDEFMVLASDGVWDVLSPEDIVRMIVQHQKRNSIKEPDALEAKMLAEMIKNVAYDKGSKDNMAVVVILFNGFSRLKRRKRKNEIKIAASRSTSVESQLSRLSDFEPLYTASDSELATLQDQSEDEEEIGTRSRLLSVDALPSNLSKSAD